MKLGENGKVKRAIIVGTERKKVVLEGRWEVLLG